MKEYKGDIKGFPEEVVEWMLDQQEKQGNKRDIKVFEGCRYVSKIDGGFDFEKTKKDVYFCNEVITYRNFNLFFENFPTIKNKYPKVMLVSNDGDHWYKRVVFMVKCGKFISWDIVDSMEEAENIISTNAWNYAKEVEPVKIKVKLTKQEIADKFNISIDLIEII